VADEFGLTLQEAAEQYADRQLWNEFQMAAERAGGRRPVGYFTDAQGIPLCGQEEFEVIQRGNAAVADCDRHWTDVTIDLWTKLSAGELIASGFECPPRLDSARRQVPRHLFRILNPNFNDSSLIGHSITIIDVRIRRASDSIPVPEAEMDNAWADAAVGMSLSAGREEAKIDVPPRGERGRPGLPPEFEQELRRRAEAGQLCDTLNQEATCLHAWGTRSGFRNPKGAPWAKNTIRNKLKDVYWELSARKSHPN
jgi:hypothetical protein